MSDNPYDAPKDSLQGGAPEVLDRGFIPTWILAIPFVALAACGICIERNDASWTALAVAIFYGPFACALVWAAESFLLFAGLPVRGSKIAAAIFALFCAFVAGLAMYFNLFTINGNGC